jgi:hypothetical protein
MLKLLKRSWRRYRYPSRHRKLRQSINHASRTDSKSGLYFEFRFFAASILCLVFYFIAANIGSGWIYLLSASLLTILVTSIIAPLILVNSLTVGQDLPANAIAGEPLVITLHLTSPAWLPVYWLQVGYEFAAESGRAKAPLVIDSLQRGSNWQWTIESPVRGNFSAGKVVVSSSFPLGMTWAKKVFPDLLQQSVTIYPQTCTLDGFLLYKLNPSGSGSGGQASGSLAVRQSTYTRGVREYVRGDSPRIVHWASSARTGKLLVREFEAEGLPSFDVLLDLAADWQTREQFELAVTTAGSLLTLGYKLGIGPELICSPQEEITGFDLPALTPGIQYCLEILARVQPVDEVHDTEAPSPSWENLANPERCLIIIRPEGQSFLSGNCYAVEIAAAVQPVADSSSLWPASGDRLCKSLIGSQEDLRQL